MDEDILRKIKNKDQQALTQLLQDHYQFLYKYTVQLTGNPEDAKDVTQETMVKVIRSIHTYEKKAKFSTWLIRIATNVFLDMKRKEKRREHYKNERHEEACYQHKGIEWSDTLEVLSSLEDGYRIPILLKHLYGYEYKEIGKIMGLKGGTVKSRVHYGIEILRKELQEDD
ncbi:MULTISPECIES: RNA polymerase sigma factor SigY [Pontibacillus]|uniref:RNA polymerase sigma factor SigY n=1 Tax=Pontibacillus chungwhensis TaxID=265426 RepID=A0ABY8URN7_9BACI|nr:MULTISPECIES: RNA polymerase sigma factor SigY [Pontibacillus]MCD5322950.1 RNA polymerase sigma factor SigY [Pontibacillus sp. HN14]WIF96345.1 RNA polymerase sigma factor SigY [Pontibacillus chungwhensis]